MNLRPPGYEPDELTTALSRVIFGSFADLPKIGSGGRIRTSIPHRLNYHTLFAQICQQADLVEVERKGENHFCPFLSTHSNRYLAVLLSLLLSLSNRRESLLALEKIERTEHAQPVFGQAINMLVKYLGGAVGFLASMVLA